AAEQRGRVTVAHYAQLPGVDESDATGLQRRRGSGGDLGLEVGVPAVRQVRGVHAEPSTEVTCYLARHGQHAVGFLHDAALQAAVEGALGAGRKRWPDRLEAPAVLEIGKPRHSPSESETEKVSRLERRAGDEAVDLSLADHSARDATGEGHPA